MRNISIIEVDQDGKIFFRFSGRGQYIEGINKLAQEVAVNCKGEFSKYVSRNTDENTLKADIMISINLIKNRIRERHYRRGLDDNESLKDIVLLDIVFDQSNGDIDIILLITNESGNTTSLQLPVVNIGKVLPE